MKPFARSSRKQTQEPINYLSLTPQRILGSETNETGLVSLHVPRFKSQFWGRFFSSGASQKPILLKLDEIGSASWQLIDGKNTVADMIQSLEIQFGERVHPADERVTKFLSNLYKDKFICFAEIPAK
ncbi:MAG: PqqD family peptide modification chaperone [Bacteroidota bacterium]